MNSVKPRILLADGDSPARLRLGAGLTVRGFDVVAAETGSAAVDRSVSCGPDAILLGAGFADIGGTETLQRIRARTDAPLLMVSGQAASQDIVGAFERGADDYMVRPVDLDVLAARLKTLIRRTARKNRQAGVLTAGTITVDLARHEVRVRGTPVGLSPKEYDLLSYLMRNEGRMLTFRQILKAVWGDGQAYKRQYLRVYVMHLRRKLEPDPEMPRYIRSQLGVGYRFEAPPRAP